MLLHTLYAVFSRVVILSIVQRAACAMRLGTRSSGKRATEIDPDLDERDTGPPKAAYKAAKSAKFKAPA